jgi:hypothetical protein
MRLQPDQHVFQIRERRDIDEPAALDDGVEERSTSRALEAAGEEPVRPPNRDDPQLVLGSVIVDGHA